MTKCFQANLATRGGRRALAICLAAIGAFPCLMQTAKAQSQNSTLRIVIPFSAGTSVDVVGRLLGTKLGEALNRTVIVENKLGAAGLLGTREVAKTNAPRDTLLFTVSNTIVINPHIYANLGYQESELQPVAMAGLGSYLLVASPASGIKSVAELISRSKATPGRLTYGSYGVGSGSHLCMELFSQGAGITLSHVPYKTPPITDVVAGHVDLSVEPAVTAVPFVNEGRVNGLAYTTTLKPGNFKVPIPSMSETVAGYECPGWLAFFSASSAGPEFAARIHDEVQRILENPEVRAKMKDLGLDAMPMSLAEFRAYIDKEFAVWGRVVKSAGIKAQ